MKRKKLIISGLLSVVAIGGVSFVSISKKQNLMVNADECVHANVEHYEYVAPTATSTGKVEHWACCDCGSAWINGSKVGPKFISTAREALIIPRVDYVVLTAEDVTGLGIATSPANKNKACDQTLTVSGTDSDDSVWTSENEYVSVDGRKAFRISTFAKTDMRKAQDDYDWGNTTWRFMPSGLTNIESFSFEYRYDERGDMTEKVDGVAHEIIKVKAGTTINGTANYSPVALDLIADNQWHTKTIEFDSFATPTQVEFHIKHMFGQILIANLDYHEHEHSYDAAGVCSCGVTLASEMELSSVDANAPKIVTLSDLGIASPFVVSSLGGDHLFQSYDFVANKGIDLRFDYTHTADSGDKYIYFYFGNGVNEDGLILRIKTDRTFDKYNQTLLLTNNNAATTTIAPTNILVKTAGAVSDHKMFRIVMTLVDPTDNTFNFKYMVSSDGGVTWGNAWYSGEGGDPFTGIDFTYGADYFANGAHNLIRISNASTSMVISDATYGSSTLRLVNNNTNAIYGEKAITVGDEIALPKMKDLEGYKFVGWFDNNNEKYVETFTPNENNLYVLRACYINKYENSLTVSPSNAGFYTKGDSYTVPAKSEDAKPVSNIDSSVQYQRLDLYFQAKFNTTNVDAYFCFGGPYDYTDAATRAFFRFDIGVNARDARGHYTSTGNPATYFLAQGDLEYEYDRNYIIHYYFVVTNVNDKVTTFKFGAEMIDYARGTKAYCEVADRQFDLSDKTRDFYIGDSRSTLIDLCQQGVTSLVVKDLL